MSIATDTTVTPQAQPLLRFLVLAVGGVTALGCRSPI
jgi:hypothetical protein